MASLVKRSKKNGDSSYFLKWRDVDGKQHMRFAARLKKDADDMLTDLRNELRAEREGTARSKPDMETSVRAWALAWVEAVDVRDATRVDYRRIVESPTGLLAAIGDLPLGAVTKAHVRAWMGERAKAGASRLTIRNNLAPVRAAFADAIEDGRLRENPCAVARRRGRHSAIPGKPPRKVRAPEPELVTKALDAATGEFRVVFLLAAACGLRRGEVYGLKWGDIADDARTISVRRANLRGRLVDVKTESSEREVPLFAGVRKALLEHRMASRFKDDEDLVFPDAVGRPQHSGTVCDRDLQATFKAAGLPERAFTFHSLRHYAVTQARRVGRLDVLVIQRIAGHSRPSITLDVYSDLFKSDIADAADAFDPLTMSEAGRR